MTTTPTEEWRSFKWVDPQLITYKTRDGVDVYARLFTPEMIGARRDPAAPAVVFVHGAGYAQNAHKYWPSYYREYMFHNLLASRGYVVLDPTTAPAPATAATGARRSTATWAARISRTSSTGRSILVDKQKVNPKRIGVYGGSYGGFITLMAMFTSPDTFAAGAALRPVTDWSHYNHGYTSNILNEPQADAEAYRKSSPIYFAEGLKGALLICHGMVDTNVLFQDSVRLVQRLIELRKENWSVAPYPGREPRVRGGDELGRRVQADPEAVRASTSKHMTRDELLDLFRRSGALLEGHFRLTSGLHSPGYLQCALVLQHPQHAEALGRAIADRTRELAADGRALAGARRRRHRPRGRRARSACARCSPSGRTAR